MDTNRPAETAVDLFWARARKAVGLTRLDVIVGTNERAALTPPAWSFSGPPETADGLLALVLEGTKRATASPLWEWEAADEQVPEPGDLSIILDARGEPQALVREDTITVAAFNEVSAEHAAAEGEGDRSLAQWREVHQRVFASSLEPYGRAFAEDMPVVLETFTLLYPKPPRAERG